MKNPFDKVPELFHDPAFENTTPEKLQDGFEFLEKDYKEFVDSNEDTSITFEHFCFLLVTRLLYEKKRSLAALSVVNESAALIQHIASLTLGDEMKQLDQIPDNADFDGEGIDLPDF